MEHYQRTDEIYHRPKPYPDPEPDPDTGSRPIPHHCYDKEGWILVLEQQRDLEAKNAPS